MAQRPSYELSRSKIPYKKANVNCMLLVGIITIDYNILRTNSPKLRLLLRN
jgi:hypothetical protein